jgi:hypothetical protein
MPSTATFFTFAVGSVLIGVIVYIRDKSKGSGLNGINLAHKPRELRELVTLATGDNPWIGQGRVCR